MIGFERAGLFLLLLLVPPLLWWLHRRRSEPRRAVVSSLLLWRRVFDDAAIPVAHRRRLLELVLEGLASVALIAAAAGPYHETTAAHPVSVTALIDRRPGMGATVTPGGPSRLAVATARLQAWLADLPPDTRIRVLTVPAAPGSDSVFRLGDGALGSWLGAIGPAREPADFLGAVASLSAFPGIRIVVTDDSPLQGTESASGLFWLAVGRDGENAGIIWAQVRSGEGAGSGPILSIGVLNGGSRPVSRRLTIATTDRTAELARIRLDPGTVWGRDDLTIPAWAAPRPFSVRLDRGDAPDQLSADDVVTFRPEPGRELAVVSRESVPGEVLIALGALGAEVVRAGEARASEKRPTLFWKVLPPPETASPFLLVATEGRFEGLRFGPGYRPLELSPGEAWTEVGGVGPYPRRVTNALEVHREGRTNWVVELYAQTPGGGRIPLVLRRVAPAAIVLAFDPVQDAAGWPKAESFPAFFYHALGQSGEAHSARGLLSAADTALGRKRIDPAPAAATVTGPLESERRALHAWFLAFALVALTGIWLLEV
jgi:hypothetical protein